jgi:hypothetical protein
MACRPAYDISRNVTVGTPISVGGIWASVGYGVFKFGSVWLLADNGLMKVDLTALACQVTPACAKPKETHFPGGKFNF